MLKAQISHRAGKSSIMQCLLRMIELSDGNITIDGVDSELSFMQGCSDNL